MRETRDAVIIGANRIPFARAHSACANVNQDMLTSTLNGLVAR